MHLTEAVSMWILSRRAPLAYDGSTSQQAFAAAALGPVPNLSEAQMQALEDYMGGDYYSINRYLRGSETPPHLASVEAKVAALDEAFDAVPRRGRRMSVFRAVGLGHLPLDGAPLPRMTFADDGFVSTTLDRGHCLTWLGEERDTVLELTVAASVPGIYAGRHEWPNQTPVTAHLAERELLLPRGVRITLTSGLEFADVRTVRAFVSIS